MLVTALKRSPDQLHGTHESDAELIRLPGNGQVLRKSLAVDHRPQHVDLGPEDPCAC